MRPPSAKQWRKAARLLHQRKVRRTAPGCYHVQGETGEYDVQWTQRDGWMCTCPLLAHRPSWACSHVAACWMVEEALKGEGQDGRDEEAATVRTDGRPG